MNGSVSTSASDVSEGRREGKLHPDVRIIRSLIDSSKREELVNPENPEGVADGLTVTFRPVPNGYSHEEVRTFRRELRDLMMELGVEVLDWDDARRPSGHLFSRWLGGKKIRGEIDAVFHLWEEHSAFRSMLLSLSDTFYKYVLRSPDRDVREILSFTSWAEYLPKHYVQNPFNTQVITLKPLDPEFTADDVSYERRISVGLSHLINTMSEFVIGVSPDQFALMNMNMSDTLYQREDLRSFLIRSLLPKTAASIRPPLLSQFRRTSFDPGDSDGARSLVELGNRLEDTGLFPRGTRFNDLIDRVSRRDVLDRYLEGRTGVSYGFLAYIEPPEFEGARELTRSKWLDLDEIDGKDPDLFRRNRDGRWFVCTESGGRRQYRQIPDLRVVTSRSGCEKTDLDPARDIVRVGLEAGSLLFQSPEGVGVNRKDIRPSFDTYVIVANALAMSLYAPDLLAGGAPLVHFHGYPHPDWFRPGEVYTGSDHLSVSCGTVEAAILNYSGIANVTGSDRDDLRLICVVEPDHGVNILSRSIDYVVSRIREGCAEDQIRLGGQFLKEYA